MPKRILIFSTAYFPFVGGAEVAIKEITDRITDVEFDLITARFKKSLPKFERLGNVNVYRVGFGSPLLDKLLLPFLGAVKTLFLNRKNKYNTYWCVMVSFASGAAYLANIFSGQKTPIILTLQEGDSETHLTYRWFGLLNLSWKLALKYASEVTALSTYLAERAKRFGYKKEVKIIPNGVDVEKFSKNFSALEKLQARKNLNLNEDDTVIITSSRLVKKNGIEDVIEAMPMLNEKIKFVICGEGIELYNLKNLSNKLGVSERVIFAGNVSHAELPLFLKSSNVFIRPSLSEGFGISFIEAMAARVPVIATKVGGIPDFLEDGVTGLFCNVNDPQSIVNKVMEYAGNPELTEKITENAYIRIKQKYDWGLIFLQYKKVFESL